MKHKRGGSISWEFRALQCFIRSTDDTTAKAYVTIHVIVNFPIARKTPREREQCCTGYTTRYLSPVAANFDHASFENHLEKTRDRMVVGGKKAFCHVDCRTVLDLSIVRAHGCVRIALPFHLGEKKSKFCAPLYSRIRWATYFNPSHRDLDPQLSRYTRINHLERASKLVCTIAFARRRTVQSTRHA